MYQRRRVNGKDKKKYVDKNNEICVGFNDIRSEKGFRPHQNNPLTYELSSEMWFRTWT